MLIATASTTNPAIRTYTELWAYARQPDTLLTRCFAGVIGRALEGGQTPIIRGMADATFQDLLAAHFPGAVLGNGEPLDDASLAAEIADLAALLLEHRADSRPALEWLAQAIASAAMGSDHLWQDMGLPDRGLLSRLLSTYFPSLAALNRGDMKWKKFFYKQLCQRAEVPLCKAPHCQACSDYVHCFGAESGDAHWFAVADPGG